MEQYSSTDMSFDTQNSENDPVRSASYGRFPKQKLIYASILGYCVVHFIIRIFTSPILTIDEANFALLGQSFQLGYGSDHPPLLSWIFTTLSAPIGINLYIVAGLKYILMGIGLCAFYKSTLTIYEWMDETGILHKRLDLAAAATGSWALIFMVGWSSHEDQLPQILDFTLLSITLLSLTLALTNKGFLWWAVFGISIGLSLLSHLHLVLFPFSLICAAMGMKSLTRPHYDANGDTLTPPAITWIHVGIAMATAMLVVTPHAMWLLQNGGPASQLTLADFGFSADIDLKSQQGLSAFAMDRGLALRSQAISAIQYIMPLGVIFIMLFWPMWISYVYPFFPKRDVDEGPFERTWRRLFSNTIRLSILFVALSALVTGSLLGTRWMLPVFFALPIWLFFQVQRSGPYFISMRGLATIIVCTLIIVPIARVVVWSEDIMSCKETRCRAYLPVQDFSDSLTLEGFASGTIVGEEPHLTGNFRTHYPDARILDANYPAAAFPQSSSGRGTCIAVWRDNAEMPDTLALYLRDQIGIRDINRSPGGAIRKNLINSLDKHSVLYYRFLKPNKNCR